MSQLERLKADLEVLDRYHVSPDITRHVKESIVRIEDAADPWHEAKKWLEQCRASTDVATKRQIAFVDHLNDEIDRLTNRVEELEAEPEFTPAVLKRADEIVLGDVVLEGGAIRTVTEIDLEPNTRIIRYHDLRGWHKNNDLMAVLPGLKERKGAGND